MANMAIIGSAGRRDDAARMNSTIYAAMVKHAEDMVIRRQVDCLVSGGAAFSDHVAVTLFLNKKVKSLILFMPALFKDGEYVARNGVKNNDAITANKYHRNFSKKCSLDSLADIDKAINKGATVEFLDGYKQRNLEVAAIANNILAYTFGNSVSSEFGRDGGASLGDKDQLEFSSNHDESGFTSARIAGLKPGGTEHTWNEAWKAEWKRHVNLNELI